MANGLRTTSDRSATEAGGDENKVRLSAERRYAQPVVPEGKWFKPFSGMIVRGEGELFKTFLVPGQVAEDAEVR